MQRHLDEGLGHINHQLLSMAGYVEQAIECATAAWRTRSLRKIKEVYEIEEKVNALHVELDSACFHMLALHQPVAADLRTIVSAIKINTDLERMVDLAVNIANNTEYYLKNSALVQIEDLSAMSDEVRLMVRQVLDAFVNTDQSIAEEVLTRDDKVDAYKQKIFEEVQKFMKINSAAVEQGLNVILMAKNLERIGDHATNIAEDVIFTASGEDIRHSAGPVKKQEGG